MTEPGVEQILEPDAIETPGERPASESLELVVSQAAPGSAIVTNIDIIVASVKAMLEHIDSADVVDADSYRNVKQTRAQIRKIKSSIDFERRRLTDLYERPVRAFTEQVKRATGPLDEADKALKAKLDGYELRLSSMRSESLRQHYEELAPDLAELVPFEHFMELRGTKGPRGDYLWLRRTTNLVKAQEGLEKVLLDVSNEWDSLGALCSSKEELDRLHAIYAETLDKGAAVSQYMESTQREQMIRQQREAEQEWLERQRQEQAYQEPLSTQPEPESEPVYEWTVTLQATPTRARQLAQVLKGAGFTGHVTRGREIREDQ